MILARWLSKTEMGNIVSLGIGVELIPRSIVDWLGWVMYQKSLTSKDEAFSKSVISELSKKILIFSILLCPTLSMLYLFLMDFGIISTLGLLFLGIVILRSFVRLFLSVEISKFNLEFKELSVFLQAILNYVLAILLYFIYYSIEVILIAWIITDIVICVMLSYRNHSVFSTHLNAMGIGSIVKYGFPVFFPVFISESWRCH